MNICKIEQCIYINIFHGREQRARQSFFWENTTTHRRNKCALYTICKNGSGRPLLKRGSLDSTHINVYTLFKKDSLIYM